MDHKYKALLQNIPTRHVITAIAKPADRQQQIAKLRNLDINNFFILGSLQLIRDVLGECRASVFAFSWPESTIKFGFVKYFRVQIHQKTNIFNGISHGTQSHNIRAN